MPQMQPVEEEPMEDLVMTWLDSPPEAHVEYYIIITTLVYLLNDSSRIIQCSIVWDCGWSQEPVSEVRASLGELSALPEEPPPARDAQAPQSQTRWRSALDIPDPTSIGSWKSVPGHEGC